MDALLQQVTNLSGIALYGAFVFVIVEAVKNFIPSGSRAKVLPVVAVALGILIVGVPSLFVPPFSWTSLIENLYRGGLIGAATTGIVAWSQNVSAGAPVVETAPTPPASTSIQPPPPANP